MANQLTIDAGVAFYTVCYEADWECLLIEGRLQKMIDSCNVGFSEKCIIINNVKNRAEVEAYAKAAVLNGTITNYYFSEDFSDELLRFFHLKRKDFVLDFFDGYYYSIGPLAAIYSCKSEYILYFTGDCMMEKGSTGEWIKEGLQILKSDLNVYIICPRWDYNNNDIEVNHVKRDGKFYYDYGFSDQVYLSKISYLKDDIYRVYNVFGERYPIYGGNHFERRVSNYLKETKKLRCVVYDACYTHIKLVSANYVPEKKSQFKKNIKFKIAKLKRALRRRNILRKALHN